MEKLREDSYPNVLKDIFQLFQNSHFLEYLLANAPDILQNDNTHTIMWLRHIFDPVKAKSAQVEPKHIFQEISSND